jgi:hypothetical protein
MAARDVPILAGGLRHHVSMHFEDWMELVVKGFEVVGVAILAIGSLAALMGPVWRWCGAIG